MQVRRRFAGGRFLVERLVCREHQRQVPFEHFAQGFERADESVSAGAAGGEDRIHGRAEIVGELSDEGADQNLAAQSLAPKGRARPAGNLRYALERKTVPASLAEDRDRGPPQIFVDLRQHLWCSTHATLLLHK